MAPTASNLVGCLPVHLYTGYVNLGLLDWCRRQLLPIPCSFDGVAAMPIGPPRTCESCDSMCESLNVFRMFWEFFVTGKVSSFVGEKFEGLEGKLQAANVTRCTHVTNCKSDDPTSTSAILPSQAQRLRRVQPGGFCHVELQQRGLKSPRHARW